MEREIKRQIRYEMNDRIDKYYHPQGRMVEDFIAHYIVERATGLTPDYIVRKAIYYYMKDLAKRRW